MSRMDLPVYLPFTCAVSSHLMILFKTVFILDASALNAIFESSLISDIGLQSFISLLSLSFFLS